VAYLTIEVRIEVTSGEWREETTVAGLARR
jgi:hypothetical protein